MIVVDDDPGVRRVLTLLLESLGYQVRALPNGAALLSLLRGDHAPVQAVLLDMTLPGLNGAALVRQLKADWPNTPVLLMSGYRAEDLLEQYGDLRGLPFLQKPFGRAALQRACVAVC